MTTDSSEKDEAVPPPEPAKKRSKSSKKKKQVKTANKKVPLKTSAKRPYPRVTLEQALRIPLAIKEKNGGNPWPPSDVAAAVGMSVKNTDFFYMAAASRDFGLTEGSRDSDRIGLTEFGRDVVYAPGKTEEEQKLKEALLNIDIFKSVLDYYKGSNLPEMQYLGNTLTRQFNLDPAFHEEFSKIFQKNCDYLKIGSGFSTNQTEHSLKRANKVDGTSTVILAEPKKDTGLRCFVAMPFRERETARSRGFSDEVLRALIAPAGREAGFEVITANRDGSDVIQATIVNYLLDADLLIADLTENNPNVLFELGLRIAENKPVALIRAKGTPAIFDVDNMLRVFEYDPNLWSSSIENDRPKLIDHVKAAWENRESGLTFIKILRERKPQ